MYLNRCLRQLHQMAGMLKDVTLTPALRSALRSETLKAHDALLQALHKSNHTPDWDRYPIGRDWFLQHCP